MSSNSNVIAFPKPHKNLPKQITVDEVNQNVEMMHHYHIQETISTLVPIIFNQLDIAGFYFHDEDDDCDDNLKDGTFVVEALRSMMLKYYDMPHPFQRIANTVFEEVDEEESTVKIVDELHLKLKDKSEEQ